MPGSRSPAFPRSASAWSKACLHFPRDSGRMSRTAARASPDRSLLGTPRGMPPPKKIRHHAAPAGILSPIPDTPAQVRHSSSAPASAFPLVWKCLPFLLQCFLCISKALRTPVCLIRQLLQRFLCPFFRLNDNSARIRAVSRWSSSQSRLSDSSFRRSTASPVSPGCFFPSRRKSLRLPSTLCQKPLFCCRFFCRLLCGKRIKFFLSVAARISRKRQELLLRLLQTQFLLCRRAFLPVKFLIRSIARRLRLLPLFLRRLYCCFTDRILGKGRRMRMCQGAADRTRLCLPQILCQNSRLFL